MKSSKMKKLCAVALTVVLGTSILAGCGGKDGSGASKQEIVYNMGEDPKTIDPQLNTSANAGNIILNTFEGLTRMDKDSKAAPGVADGVQRTREMEADARKNTSWGCTPLWTLWSHKSFLLESSKPSTDMSRVLPRSFEVHRWRM